MNRLWDNMERLWLLMLAANDEALRAGHSHVDVDHVLLGLLTGDGESAGQLRAAGLTLDAARTAMAQLAREDLATIGLADEGWPVGPPDRYAAEILPFTARAEAAVKALTREAPDTVVLDAVLATPDGLPARLLRQAGIDPARLSSVRPPDAADAPEESEWVARVDYVAPVPIERLWALLDDPLRRPEWDEDVAEVRRVDGTTFEGTPRMERDQPLVSRAFGFAGSRTTYRTTQRTDGRSVDWEITVPGRRGGLRARHPSTERLHVELHPEGPGSTRITLATWSPPRPGRLQVPGLAGMQRARLRLLGQALAQAA